MLTWLITFYKKLITLINLKQHLHSLCLDYVTKRIESIQNAIVTAQNSANEETKSSAGDKYETGRAMMQLEIEKNTVQLAEAMKLKHALDDINPAKQTTAVQPGSLVLTGQHNYYLSISAGQLLVDGKMYFAISPASPIGTQLRGLKAGDTFIFNTKTVCIEHVS